MKTINLLLALVAFGILTLVFGSLSVAQTSVPGGVVNGTWTLAGSPYNVQGSIQIVNGDSLIIQPGVTVNFQGTYKLLVLGKLKAIGSITDTITFTATNIGTGWRGIRFDNTPSSNDTSRIIFCKLQYGKATGLSPDDVGGGIYLKNYSKVIISNSSIINCNAYDTGGGIYCDFSSPTISNNFIFNNSSTNSNGGGISSYGASPIFINNTISYNSARSGGGLCCNSGTPNIFYNIISNNTTLISGGGIFFNANGSIANNTISNNTTGSNGGGGIYSINSTTISNNIITNNAASLAGGGLGGGGIHAEGNQIISNNVISNNSISGTGTNNGGGGIHISNSSITATTSLNGNIISNNTASVTGTDSGGGGIYCDGNGLANDSSNITNNTIVNNIAPKGGGLYCAQAANPVLRNTILWGNTASTSGAQVFLSIDASDPDFYYCDVQGGSAAFELNGNFYTGTYQNNIDTPVLFVSPSGGSGIGFNGVIANWSLQVSSPCIDTGDPNGTYPATDIAGNPRVSSGIIDIGAYEFQIAAGIADNKNNFDINLYPNPSTGKFSFQSIEGNISVIEIYNLIGENIYTQNLNQQTSNEIDISASPKGIYFVRVYDRKKIHSEKIVVQ